MLTEGVPPAMIENVGSMAGMPVGPLSLNDEVGARSRAARSSRRPRRISATAAIDPGAGGAARRDGREARAASAARTARASTTIRRGGQKRLWPGLADLQPTQLDPDAIDIAGAEAALPRRRRRWRRRAPSRKASSPIRARPMSARSSASASRPSPAARCPTSTSWARRPSWRSATACRTVRRSLRAAGDRRRDGEGRRQLLRPGAGEAGGLRPAPPCQAQPWLATLRAMARGIDYYYSLVSPWAYIGHAPFMAIAAEHGPTIITSRSSSAASSPRRAACRCPSATRRGSATACRAAALAREASAFLQLQPQILALRRQPGRPLRHRAPCPRQDPDHFLRLPSPASGKRS